ncbi:uncharacterized protein [Coffea arabica]|uniref:HAT C-terminal dimerisation domain-containing protein n=1 Tax=Coffea arabica TaxID=13443 RepID=A0ABM4V9F7_COFAR
MRGEWNGLQALFIQECPYAYYIHCFAHRLQLTLVATSQEVIPVEQFFTNLSLLINLVSSSCKRVDQLRVARIAELIAIDELETGRGQNQMGTSKRPGTTRWGSHFSSICSLFTEYEDICSILIDVINYGNTSTQRSEADRVYDFMTFFDFVLVMHMMRDILGFAQVLSQALQCKSQDILNALKLVSVTKDRLQSYRDDGWNELFTNGKTFCDARNIEMPDMNVIYKAGRGRIRKQNDPITMEHHYRIDVFLATVDSQILEMKNRFKEDLQNLSSLQELCQVLAKTRKSMCYTLIDRLIRLILTLPVSTATTERAFSAMKIIKTCLRSRMEEDFLANSMIITTHDGSEDTEDTKDSDNNVDDDLDKEEEDNSSNENDFGPPFVEAEEEDQIEEHDDPDNYGGFKENDDPEHFDNDENNGNLIRILTWMGPNVE